MGRAEEVFSMIRTDGLASIREFIITRQSEELFLDFKRSSDNGAGDRISQTDRNNLAKAISGFANSEGGVLVWGIDCSPDDQGSDVAKSLFPLADAKRFRSWLEGAVSGSTIPPHSGVESIVVPDESGVKGYVAQLIPKSLNAPHQMILKRQYYIRAGSDFVPTPHDVLAGLFGRRPQPNVFHMFTTTSAKLVGDEVSFQVGFMIHNKGPGIATDVFITLMIVSTPGDRCKLEFDVADRRNWTGQFSLGRILSLIAKPEQRLPPSSHFQPVVLKATLAPPFEHELKIKCMIGCTGAPCTEFFLGNDAQSIATIHKRFLSRARTEALHREDCRSFSSEVLNIKGDNE